MNKKGIIYGINGPVIYLKGNTGLRMSEMVHVGEEHLVGEVISLSKKATTVQVFEETTGLKPGAEVVGTGDAISVTLGPGILNNIFDGIERPLRQIYHPWCQRRFSGYLQKMECSCDSIRGRSCNRRNRHRGNPGNRKYPSSIHGSSGCGGNRYQSST